MQSAINKKQIEDDIYAWVNTFIQPDSGTSWNVVIREQKAPQPNPPYTTLKIITDITKLGLNSNLRPDPDDATGRTLAAFGDVRLTCSIQSFGNGAREAIDRLRSSLDLPEVNEDYFRSKGYSTIEIPPIEDVTEALNTVFEERAIMELGIYLKTKITSTVSTIETVQGEYSISKADGSTVDGDYEIGG